MREAIVAAPPVSVAVGVWARQAAGSAGDVGPTAFDVVRMRPEPPVAMPATRAEPDRDVFRRTRKLIARAAIDTRHRTGAADRKVVAR